ncbi:hypothetical protein ACLMJK_008757 [Lecanora helva]
MSSSPLTHQLIRDTSAIDGSIALAGYFPIPFRRDVDFVDRGNLLRRVDEICSQPAGRAGLVGLGGVGKSQIAIEYTYRIRERSPDTWIFWVHSSNAARFEQGYRDIASAVKIARREGPKANIFELVHDWLRDFEGKWLVILDNVDHPNSLSEARDARQLEHGTTADNEHRQPILDYVPQSQNGSILVTSRKKHVALNLVEEKDVVEVQPMTSPDALLLFEKKLGPPQQSNDIADLAASLGYMPLAIVQAAAYISRKSPRYSVQQYLEDFRRSDGKRSSLLNYEGGHLRRDLEANNSIITTWQISFECIRRERLSAAHLLSLMSFFDRQGILENLVRNRADIGNGREQDKEDSESVRSEDDGFEDDVQMLRDYSLLSIGMDGTFEMHALVQLATRKWLEANNELEHWKESFIKNLLAEFPGYEKWKYCHTLFPHAKSASTQRPKAEGPLKKWSLLLYRVAWYACETGNIKESIAMSEVAMKEAKKIYGQEHPITLSSIRLVSHAISLAGRWKEAEESLVPLVEITKRLLGIVHPLTLTVMNDLAVMYSHQGRWEAAKELLVPTIEINKRARGEEHPGTLRSLNNLASIYQAQGSWKEAEELNLPVLEISTRVLGEEHPDTLYNMYNLAKIYSIHRHLKEAEELYEKVINLQKKVLGDEHPDTLVSMSDLAVIYEKQGRWKEAEELHVQLIEIKKRMLGEEHPDTLTSMHNLAKTYFIQGYLKEAEERYAKVTNLQKRVLGDDHPDTLVSMHNLAVIYEKQGRWKEAEELYVQVTEIEKRVLGEEHQSTFTSMNNLAVIYWTQARWEKVEELYVQLIEIEKRVVGEEHPDTLRYMVCLAMTLENLDRHEDAIATIRNCSGLRKQIPEELDTKSWVPALCERLLKPFWEQYSSQKPEKIPVRSNLRRQFAHMLQEWVLAQYEEQEFRGKAKAGCDSTTSIDYSSIKQQEDPESTLHEPASDHFKLNPSGNNFTFARIPLDNDPALLSHFKPYQQPMHPPNERGKVSRKVGLHTQNLGT